jgi:hypothetical protein
MESERHTEECTEINDNSATEICTCEGYTEAYVVVEGAQDEEEVFEDTPGVSKRFRAWLKRIQTAAKEDGLKTEIYTIYHGHANDGEECSCVQYLTDHRPDYVFNKEGK